MTLRRKLTRREQRIRAYLQPGAKRWSWWWVYLRNPYTDEVLSQRFARYDLAVTAANVLLDKYTYYPHAWIVEKLRLL